MARNQDSRYNRTLIVHAVDRDGVPSRPAFVDVLAPYANIAHQSNRLYRLRQSDEWHRLAHRFYGRGQDYWVLLDFNGIVDPFEDLTGQRIVVPSNDVVQFEIKDFEQFEIVEGPE